MISSYQTTSFDLELFGSDCSEKHEQVAVSEVCFRPQFVNLKLRYEDHEL